MIIYYRGNDIDINVLDITCRFAVMEYLFDK